MKSTVKCFTTIELILIVLFILHDMPAISVIYPSVIYAFVIIFLFISLIRRTGQGEFKMLIALFSIPTLMLIIHLFHDIRLISALQELSGLFQSMMYTLIALPLLRTKDVKEAKFLLLVYFLTSFITCLTTGYGCTIYPGAARELAVGNSTEFTDNGLYMRANIGGFSFVYIMTLTIPILIFYVRNFIKHHKYSVLLSIIYLFCIGYMLVNAEYTTALLISVVFLTLFFINQTNVNISRVLFGIFFCAIIAFSCKSFISLGLFHVADSIESRDVSNRLQELAYSLEGNNTASSGDLESRKEKYNKSFNTFMEHPFGVWTDSTGIGGHSFVFDKMAIFGILGVILIIVMICSMYNHYVAVFKNSNIYIYSVFLFIAFCVLILVNPKAFYTPLTFTLPLLTLVTNSQEA